MKNINKIFLIVAATIITACSSIDDYLDKEPSSDQSYVSTISDCDALLNKPELIGGYSHTCFLDDCIDFSSINDLFSIGSAEYNEFTYWTDTKYILDPASNDPCWNGLYSNIYYTNVVIDKIDGVSGDDETQRSQLKGEAYMGRAFYHFMSVNTYSKEYNPSTASTDVGVPYVKDIDTQGSRTRGTVKENYDNIIADMEIALANLKNTTPKNDENHRGNIAGANAFLAKVYLHMQDWANAEKYAKASLNIYKNLIDYNNYIDYDGYKASDNYNSFKNAEVTYLKGDIQTFNAVWVSMSIQFGAFMGGLYLTNELTNTLDFGNDLRFNLFMDIDIFSGNITITGDKMYDALFYGYTNIGCSTAETYLILAEALARQNKTADACNTLNDFLKTRYDNSTFVAYSSTVQADIINKITDEKKFEFVYTGNRWFEMRRLNMLGEYSKTVTRTDASGNVIGSLVASPARLTLPIPQKLTDINPNITQNPFE